MGTAKHKKLPDGVRFQPVSFKDLPGWAADDHKAAFATFLVSCEQITRSQVRLASLGQTFRPKFVSRACARARNFKKAPDRETARLFFETYFEPHKVVAPKRRRKGLLTGYYEPVLMGSRTKTKRFNVPIYKKPPDLVRVRKADWRGNADLKGLTAGRKTATGIRPYLTRGEIDQGGLDGKGLELLYLEDEVDAFFLHIQGSGRVRFPDGTHARINFAGRNGHPYSSVGRYMIRKGMLKRSKASMKSIKRYIQADLKKRRPILWENRSYIFFRELKNHDSKAGPLGAMGVPLTAERSLAVDTRYHELGMPIYVVSSSLKAHRKNGFRKLMVAQDVGSAIKGPERGDIYWGSGNKAGRIAGRVKNQAQFFVLLAKQ